MKITIAFFFALFAAAVSACSCFPPPTFQEAVLNAKNTDAPYAVATVISEDRPADPGGVGNIQITYTVRPEGCKRTYKVTTGGNGALCGVVLKINTKYVLQLKMDGSPTGISSCGVWSAYDDLSKADRAFVAENVPGRCTLTGSCAVILCPPGTVCRRGKCVGISCPIYCPPGTFCFLEKCRDRCIFMKCGPGYTCKLGKCIPSGKCTEKCTIVQCVQAPCPPSCMVTGCPVGYRCPFGKCIPPKPVLPEL